MAAQPDHSMATPPANGQAETASEQLTANLHVVSPSFGTGRPLVFPGLAANTTIRQLKEKIRQSLPQRPTDENQRLIYRGRALQRDMDTLETVFGADLVGDTAFFLVDVSVLITNPLSFA
jgi:hypothetical protein